MAYNQKLIFSMGKVSQVLQEGRDSVMLPSACIQVDVHTWSGMSGGPVFDSDGYLIGVLSVSMESPELNGPSFASLAWPCLSMMFSGGWPRDQFSEPHSLLTLAPQHCLIEGVEALTFPEKGKIRLTYWD